MERSPQLGAVFLRQRGEPIAQGCQACHVCRICFGIERRHVEGGLIGPEFLDEPTMKGEINPLRMGGADVHSHLRTLRGVRQSGFEQGAPDATALELGVHIEDEHERQQFWDPPEDYAANRPACLFGNREARPPDPLG